MVVWRGADRRAPRKESSRVPAPWCIRQQQQFRSERELPTPSQSLSRKKLTRGRARDARHRCHEGDDENGSSHWGKRFVEKRDDVRAAPLDLKEERGGRKKRKKNEICDERRKVERQKKFARRSSFFFLEGERWVPSVLCHLPHLRAASLWVRVDFPRIASSSNEFLRVYSSPKGEG